MATDSKESSLSLSNDAFQKFLDEPLSTSESEKSLVSVVVEEKKEIPQVVHGWLKKRQPAEGSSKEEEKVIVTAENQDHYSSGILEVEEQSIISQDVETSPKSGSSLRQLSTPSNNEKISSESGDNSVKDYSSSFESEEEETLKDDVDDTLNANTQDLISAPGEDKISEKPAFLEVKMSSDNKTHDKLKVSDSSSNKEITEEHTFFEMVMHSKEAESEIIQELSIDEQKLPDVLQDSSESSDSQNNAFQLEQVPLAEEKSQNESSDVMKNSPETCQKKNTDNIKLVHEQLKTPVRKIPRPIKHTGTSERKQSKGKSVSFARGVLSTSEQRLEKEIQELRTELDEQEKLITGYQQENEKLYFELKHLKKGAHISETKWRIEVEKLRMEVGKLRGQAKDGDLGHRSASRTSNKEESHEQCAAAFKKLKEEVDLGKKELGNLQDKTTDFQNQIRELSKNNEDLTKMKFELMEKNKMLQAQLQETELLSAKWKFEATESKKREQNQKTEVVSKKDKKASCTESDPLRLHITTLIQEFQEKDANTKVTLNQLAHQYAVLKESYVKELQEKELEKIKMKEEMEGNIFIAQKELQHTQEKLRWKFDLSRFKNIGVQVGCSSGVNLENKEMKLQVERLTLQLEDLEIKYEQLQSSKSHLPHTTTARLNHQAIIKKVCMEERKHSSAVVYLQNKVENLEILTQHLSDKLRENHQRSLLLVNENSVLKKTIEELNSDLLMTCKDKSVEGRMFFNIERMISDLQKWHKQRETALKEAVAKCGCNCSQKLQSQLYKLQQRVVEQNQEIDVYRKELDTLSVYLQQLQENG